MAKAKGLESEGLDLDLTTEQFMTGGQSSVMFHSVR